MMVTIMYCLFHLCISSGENFLFHPRACVTPEIGMGDIDILAYDYCEASISRLSQLLN